MTYRRFTLLIPACLLALAGCAGETASERNEYARSVSHSEAIGECRKLSDASAYLECKKRASAVHAKR